MSDLYWLTDEQMARLAPYFPKSHGKPRVDDRRETWSAADWVPYGYRPSLSQMRWALSAACEFQKRSDVMIVRRA